MQRAIETFHILEWSGEGSTKKNKKKESRVFKLTHAYGVILKWYFVLP